MNYDEFRLTLPKDYNPFTHENPNIIFFNQSVRCFLNPYPYMKNHLLISPVRKFEFPYKMPHRLLYNYFYAVMAYGRYMVEQLGDAYGILRIQTKNKSVQQTHFHIMPKLPETNMKISFFNNVLEDISLHDEMRLLRDGMLIVRFGISGVKFLYYKNDEWMKINRDPNPDLNTPFIQQIIQHPPKVRQLKLL